MISCAGSRLTPTTGPLWSRSSDWAGAETGLIAEDIRVRHDHPKLLELGCYRGQGYSHFATRSAAELSEMLREGAVAVRSEVRRTDPGPNWQTCNCELQERFDAESMRDESDDDSGSAAKLISDSRGRSGHRFWGRDYEPWFVPDDADNYRTRTRRRIHLSILELFATRHSLTDVAVVLVNESFGTRDVRLGGEAVDTPKWRRTSTRRGCLLRPTVPRPNVTPSHCVPVRCPCTRALQCAHDPLTQHCESRSSMRPSKFRRAQRSPLRSLLGLWWQT